LKLDGIGYSQLARAAIWDVEQTYDGGDDDGAGGAGLGVPFEPFEGPVAARGGNSGDKGGGGGNGGKGDGGGKGGGTAPTKITLTNASVDENSAGGTEVGVLGAVDIDNKERFTFSIIGDADGLFAISGKNKLVVADGANLDYEAYGATGGAYEIIVQVTDKQGNTYLETMTISINDVWEAPNTAPTDMRLSDNSIPEGSANGALVGVLTTTDADPNETFTYTLTDSAGGRFVMDGDRLEIADSSLIDFETGASHTVTVRVTDSAGNFYDETFTIQIEDVIPTFAEPDSF